MQKITPFLRFENEAGWNKLSPGGAAVQFGWLKDKINVLQAASRSSY